MSETTGSWSRRAYIPFRHGVSRYDNDAWGQSCRSSETSVPSPTTFEKHPFLEVCRWVSSYFSLRSASENILADQHTSLRCWYDSRYTLQKEFKFYQSSQLGREVLVISFQGRSLAVFDRSTLCMFHNPAPTVFVQSLSCTQAGVLFFACNNQWYAATITVIRPTIR
jgi:hypothetical protein